MVDSGIHAGQQTLQNASMNRARPIEEFRDFIFVDSLQPCAKVALCLAPLVRIIYFSYVLQLPYNFAFLAKITLLTYRTITSYYG